MTIAKFSPAAGVLVVVALAACVGAAVQSPAPDFVTLMKAPWRDEGAVDRFLRAIAESEPHPGMPGFWLDPAERQQLTAYLTSLRPDATQANDARPARAKARDARPARAKAHDGAAGGWALAQAWCRDCHGPPPPPGP